MNHRKEDRKIMISVRARKCLHERIKAMAREEADPAIDKLTNDNARVLADMEKLKKLNYKLVEELSELKEVMG